MTTSSSIISSFPSSTLAVATTTAGLALLINLLLIGSHHHPHNGLATATATASPSASPAAAAASSHYSTTTLLESCGCLDKCLSTCLTRYELKVEPYWNSSSVPENVVCCGLNAMRACILQQINTYCPNSDVELTAWAVKRKLTFLTPRQVHSCATGWLYQDSSPLCWELHWQIVALVCGVIGLSAVVGICVRSCSCCSCCGRRQPKGQKQKLESPPPPSAQQPKPAAKQIPTVYIPLETIPRNSCSRISSNDSLTEATLL